MKQHSSLRQGVLCDILKRREAIAVDGSAPVKGVTQMYITFEQLLAFSTFVIALVALCLSKR